jgi:hypothetical protein
LDRLRKAERLSGSGAAKLKRAIETETTKLHRSFDEQVQERVRKNTAEQRVKFRDLIDEEQAEVLRYRNATANVSRFMTRDELKLMLDCLDPQRAPEGRRKRFAKAFAVAKRLEEHFE